MATKRSIPVEIKRKLRQEASFGCCKCGNPILEYHHIESWANTKKHNIENMMVLCPTCHHSIDSFSTVNQKKYKNNPFNKKQTSPNGNLIISQSICAIDTGGVVLLGDGPIIKFKENSYLEFYVNEDDLLEVTLRLFNKEGKKILSIIKNEWIKGDIDCWDIEFISASKILKIKEKQGKTNLEINAKNLPVTIKGNFWINNILLGFNSNGIFINENISLKINSKNNVKFGIFHFEEDAYSLSLGKTTNNNLGKLDKKIFATNSIQFEGSMYYSGCFINVNNNNSLELKPKPMPYEWRGGKSMTFDRAERVLQQTIDTLGYFKLNVTYINNLDNKFSKGWDIIDKSISTIPFKRKLARFYVAINQDTKALKTYTDIQKQQHEFFKQPNIEEAEILLEISKYLFHINQKDKAKKFFIEAYLHFTSTNNEPYRLLNFAKTLFTKKDFCFCGSNKLFSNCHYPLADLKKLCRKKPIPFIIYGIPEDSRIDIFVLITHKDHSLCYLDDYLEGYSLSLTEKCSGSFDTKFVTHSELPIIIRIRKYSILTRQYEIVLRQNGINWKFSGPTLHKD